MPEQPKPLKFRSGHRAPRRSNAAAAVAAAPAARLSSCLVADVGADGGWRRGRMSRRPRLSRIAAPPAAEAAAAPQLIGLLTPLQPPSASFMLMLLPPFRASPASLKRRTASSNGPVTGRKSPDPEARTGARRPPLTYRSAS